MLGYLSMDIICSEKQTNFQEQGLRKTVSVEEQIMSKDKYPSIFSKSNGDYCVYYPANIFHNTCSFENRGIFSDFPQFQEGNIQWRDTFKPIACKRKYLMIMKLSVRVIFQVQSKSRLQKWRKSPTLLQDMFREESLLSSVNVIMTTRNFSPRLKVNMGE